MYQPNISGSMVFMPAKLGVSQAWILASASVNHGRNDQDDAILLLREVDDLTVGGGLIGDTIDIPDDLDGRGDSRENARGFDGANHFASIVDEVDGVRSAVHNSHNGLSFSRLY